MRTIWRSLSVSLAMLVVMQFPSLPTSVLAEHLHNVGNKPTITAMGDDALVATYPEQDRSSVYFHANARFSPDGKFLAIVTTGPFSGDPEQVWLYDMNSQHLFPVIKEDALVGEVIPAAQIQDVA